ncbi:hypothetical protein N7462_007336 [Penicillium macrosclerotiorum]|uniref:uncharacterized protein n=1 Tax=Penicillium macrosclerotiorum TaxID=303699 RepID=UPI0025472327|nr:uncharacterized protein N7462_007336 [Penicillium macrosclerotiorum]KAJ5679092.1 hypothetical protein N7462_007336 [Penicillium macrosclerotiorum]
MFRSLSRPVSRLQVTRSSLARQIHQITTDFVARDKVGNLTTKKVPVFVGKNPEDAYVMIETTVGQVFRDCRPKTSKALRTPEDQCKLAFYHDTQHFGFAEPASYPRLYLPSQLPRQSDSNVSPATLWLTGKTHQIVLDGTQDAEFAEHTAASLKELKPVLDKLAHM